MLHLSFSCSSSALHLYHCVCQVLFASFYGVNTGILWCLNLWIKEGKFDFNTNSNLNKPSYCSGICDEIHATTKLQTKLHRNFFEIPCKHTWSFLYTLLKLPWNSLETPFNLILDNLEPPLNHPSRSLGTPLNLPWNTLKPRMKHPWNLLETPNLFCNSW